MCFYCVGEELFDTLSKAVKVSIKEILKESKSTTNATEELNETNVNVNVSELLKKNGTVDSTLIKTVGGFNLKHNKKQFPLGDDSDSDIWNDFIMNGEKRW